MSPISIPGKVTLAKESFRGITATGGDSVFDISFDGIRYRVHVFTTVGTSSFIVTDSGSGLHPAGLGASNTVEYLVIAGGGGGGCRGAAGGGGGGGMLEGSTPVTIQTYPIVVGAGGIGGLGGTVPYAGTRGGSSSALTTIG